MKRAPQWKNTVRVFYITQVFSQAGVHITSWRGLSGLSVCTSSSSWTRRIYIVWEKRWKSWTRAHYLRAQPHFLSPLWHISLFLKPPFIKVGFVWSGWTWTWDLIPEGFCSMLTNRCVSVTRQAQPCSWLLLLLWSDAVLTYKSHNFVVSVQVLNVRAAPGIRPVGCRWLSRSVTRPCSSPKSWWCRER